MLLTKPIRRRAKRSAYLADRLPVFALEKGKIIFRDGRVAVGFRVHGAPLESWSEGHFQQANERLARQLKLLPTGTVVQKTDVYFDRVALHYEFRPNGQPSADVGPAYYEGKLLDHFFARLVLRHESYLFLSFPTKSRHRFKRLNPITSGFSQAGSVVKNPFSGIEKLLREAEAIASEFVQGLFSLKDVSFIRLDEGALNELLIRYLKLSFNEPGSKLNREVYNNLSGLVIGEKKANVITMTGQGSEVFASVKNGGGVSSPYGYGLSQYLQFPHIVTQCLLVEDTERELKSLDFERKLNDSLE